MVQDELIRDIATGTGLTPPKVRHVFEELAGKLAGLRQGDEIRTTVLGTFSVEHKGARPGRNPRTGESIEVDARNNLKFKPAKHIRDALNA